MIYFFLFIPVALYGMLLLFLWWQWRSIEVVESRSDVRIKISVIIPARNEEENIGSLLAALVLQSYPRELFEVIVVDDHSTDKTAEIVTRSGFSKLITLRSDGINSYKKKAIETGIAAATGELIVTTDADCLPGREWLQTIASFKEETGARFIAAPVVIDCNSSVVQVFQSMDFMMLQGITGAGVYSKSLTMCNGANLAYSRTVFYEVGGFEGIDSIASGDDMLLMHKIAKRYPDDIHYLKSKNAIVHTGAMTTWRSFFQQRIRWASKATKYDDKRIFWVLGLVYLVNLLFIVTCLLIISGLMFWWDALIFLGIKTFVEIPLFNAAARFFGKTWATTIFPLFQPLHILYTIASGFFGQMGKYEWKGRKVR